MKIKEGFSLTLIAAGLVCASNGEEVAMTAEKAMMITFPSQTQRTYKLLGAENASGSWSTLQDGIVGTGGKVTIFYKSESDQKLFFKVETSEGPAGQRSLLSLANLDISNKDLSGYDLEGDDLRGYSFHESKFDGANLSAANLSGARFGWASFIGADLSHAIAEGVNFEVANFNGANLDGIHFLGGYAGYADFRNAKLKGVKFSGTVLNNANFSGQSLTNTVFRGISLDGANFSNADFTGADVSRGSLAGAILTGANVTGVNFEGSSLNGVQFTGRDLRTSFLRGIFTYSGGWGNVNAAGTDLSLAIIGPETYLANANFEGANLEGVRFTLLSPQPTQPYPPRTVEGLNFRNANLSAGVFHSVTFRNCDFTGADLSFANVVAAQFPGCIGLDPEQPGMEFGPGASGINGEPNPAGTILPDGTARIGTNPGSSLAPATVPAHVLLSIADGTRNEQIDLTFSGNTFSQDGGAQQGTVEYEGRGRVGGLKLVYGPQSWGRYKLLFTSATGGQLYEGSSGWYLAGTFSLPE